MASAAAIQHEEQPEIRASCRREFDARHFNSICNHPDVRPRIDSNGGQVDVSEQVAAPYNFLLTGVYGGCLFLGVIPGVFEVHSACLPEGRGPWMRSFTDSVLRWMFIRTNAWEITTRVPHGHGPAKALTLANGFRHEFTREDQCVFLGKSVPVDIYRLDIYDWVERSAWAEEQGRIFHDQLHAEADRLGITAPAHEDDPQHNKVAGASVEMARVGQVTKAVLFYDRWAFTARHSLISLVSEDPPVVHMDIGNMHITPTGIEVTP